MINLKFMNLLAKTDRSMDSQKNINEYNPESFSVFMDPTTKPKYYNFEIRKINKDFENKNWPDSADCDKQTLLLSDSKQYVPVYLPPENKGYT